MKALDVARWFILRNQMDYDLGITDEHLTHSKLQKLLYYAQGVFLAYENKPLFEDDILHMETGPVITEIYREYKGKIIEYCTAPQSNITEFTADKEAILENIYKEFGQFSARALFLMSREETPLKETPLFDFVSPAKMAEYFSSHYIANGYMEDDENMKKI